MGAKKSGRGADGVADRPERVDQRDAESGVHFLPEAGDENFDRAGVVFVVALPDALAQFGAGKRAAGLLEEDLEDVEFAGRERDDLPGAGDAPMTDVHVEIGDLQEIVGARRGGAAAERLDAGDELVHREGFCEVIVGAGLESFDAVFDLAPGGEDEHAGGRTALTQAGENREAVERGQVEVEHDEVVRLFEGGAQAERAVGLRGDPVTAAGERTSDVTGELGFVFDD
jgi:hypothetical protein